MRSAVLWTCLFILTALAGASAQSETEFMPFTPEAALAMSRDDYPATPGDVYRLTYSQAGSLQPVSLTLMITNAYRLNLGHMGAVDATGMVFPDLREAVEGVVGEAYPGSSAELVIQSIGRFDVVVRGEVNRAGHATADGLTRLSAIFDSYATDFASNRAVHIMRADGSSGSYDLWRSFREGRLEEDPYLRPGDSITIPEADRLVSVSGHVRRPGTYTVLDRETLRDLIERYGDGFSLGAGAISIRRYQADGRYRTMRVDYGVTPRFSLVDGDAVTVGSANINAPVVIVSGAVYGEPNDGLSTVVVPESPVVVAVPYMNGLTVGDVLRRVGGPTPYADYDSASIVRSDGVVVPFNAGTAPEDSATDIRLRPGDRIEVPFGNLPFGRSFGGQ